MNWKQTYINGILDCLYPRCCPVCGGIVTPKGQLICIGCRSKVQPIPEPRCKQCGKPVFSQQSEFCYDCSHTTHHFDQGLGLFPYHTIYKEAVMKFKYHGRREYGQFFGWAAIHFYKREVVAWNPQVILPVPVHKSRRRRRGYNQAEVLAKWMGIYGSIPVCPDGIKRIQKTSPQKQLSRTQRKRNLEQAFAVNIKYMNHSCLPWERVLIADDIYTTGSTVDSISKCLKDAGVKKVFFMTICVGKGL